MAEDINRILEKVRAMPIEDRKRFAAHKSRAIYRKHKSEQEAIIYAAKRLGIIEFDKVAPIRPVTITTKPHIPKRSALQAFIAGDLC